ncbi:heme ABC exporter ATP-binding protein CcmA [Pelagibacteraceae bacterium]|nr:heme ABC exporter ATP-binding protein CcmA [Pelagibacteraceae bacterium]
MSNKLEINGLECIRDNRPIFKDINFSVESNQTMVVRGKNGSGKTSLLRVLAGYIKNYSGNILFNGNNIKNDKELLSEFRFLGQKNTLKGNLSVQQNIAMWELIYQVKSDINEISKILNIEQILNVDINSLSDGQKKRISLARLIISNAKVWLLDEPLVYLDQDKIDLLQNIILKHNKRGGITIYSSNTDINLEYDSSIIMDDYVVL